MKVVKVPHELFLLENGLHVILHQDLRLPRVAVNVLYRVGSRHDPPRRTGMAHLFEHLMFMGTKRVPGSQFDLIMEEEGGANNAFTGEDLTDYYDVGPSRLLETLLWLEADRMASLARHLTVAKLKVQREVVLNERRQSYENAPYGKAQLELPSLLYPKNHPYSWPVIGGSEDLLSVTVSDGKRLFERFYSPANASLVVAGHFDLDHARELVTRYFGWIPAAAPPRSRPVAPARLRREVRRVLSDRVDLAKLYLVWHSPPQFRHGDAELDLAASILATGKESRLHRALVYEKRLAVEVEAQQESRQLGSLFSIEVTARPEADLEELARATQEVIDRFLARPPTKKELERARNGYEAQFVAGLERLSRRAELLNLYFTAVGQPDYLEADLARYRSVTPASLWSWSKKVLRPRGRVVMFVVPEEAAA